MLKVNYTMELATQRLILRRFEPRDIQSAYVNWAGDEEVQTAYGEPVYDSPEKTGELISSYIGKYQTPDFFCWAIILPETGECIGMVSYYSVIAANELGEIEYCIGRKYQCKGYMTEAVREVVRAGFEIIGFNRIQISCRENNPQSRRVIEKSGFVYEGTFRQFFHCADGYHDRMYFSLLASEYKG